MTRRKTLPLLIALSVLAAAPFMAPSAADKIPTHPTKLKYGELDFKVPDAKKYRHTLNNGIVVYVAEDRSLPLIKVGVTVRAGAFLEDADKPGVAAMTGSLMRVGGAGDMTAEQFDEKVDFLATQMNAFIGDTQAGASMNAYSGVLNESLNLFFTMMKSPRFQADRLQIEKDETLESMKQRNDNPAGISGREFQWLMYGQDHFSSRYMTESSVNAIARDDLVAFHKKWWQPKNMIMTVSGDVNTKSILAELNKRFKGWTSAGPEVTWPPPAPNHTPTPGVYYVEKDIPQGRTLIAHKGKKRDGWDDPDAYALSVMNDVLGGGGFTSRLVKRIRSDEGLAYSAGSSFGIGNYWAGNFTMSFQSKSPTVAFASKIALEEMKRIREEKVSDGELKIAKSSFIDVFPRRFEDAAQIAGTFAGDEFIGRPHTYWNTYQDRMRAITADDVQRVAKKYLDPSKLVFLIVGDWEDIAKGDPDGRGSMAEINGGKATQIPLRDPLTLEPVK